MSARGLVGARQHPAFIEFAAGQRFGRWTVVRYAPRAKGASAAGAEWLCRCDCGREAVVRSGNLRSGATTQCKACADSPIPDSQRVCQWCGRKTTRAPHDWCAPCDRARYRNGTHPCCGAPIRKTQPHECKGAA